MKKTSKTVIFFGNERLATGVTTSTPTLKALIRSGYTIAAIVANHNPISSRSARHLEVEQFASIHAIPVLHPSKPIEIIDQLRKLNAPIGVLVAYGKIVPQSVIDIFPYGIVNVHPSLLPLHRGPTPIESVILDGSKVTGVSIMKLVRAMDSGPVYKQTNVSLDGKETKQLLANKLAEVGSKMVVEALPKILSSSLDAIPQQESGASYDSLIVKSDGIINWDKPAIEIENQIRAFSGWPGSKTVIANKDVLITMAHVVSGSGKPGDITISKTELLISTGKDSLSVDRLKPSGKSEMDIKSFLSGYGSLL